MKKERKMKRQKAGDPSDENYKGPWAEYDGMEEFRNQETAELTEE